MAMSVATYFHLTQPPVPFNSYAAYLDTVFACVDYMMTSYLADMKQQLVNENGSYKNPLYPDIENAYEKVRQRIEDYYLNNSLTKPQQETLDSSATQSTDGDTTLAPAIPLASNAQDSDNFSEADLLSALGLDSASDLSSLLSPENPLETIVSEIGGPKSQVSNQADSRCALEILDYIQQRLLLTDQASLDFRFSLLAEKLHLAPFSTFCLAMAMMACTQTNYADAFHIINQSSGAAYPTVEAAARVFYGNQFQLNSAYAQMSETLEQLSPILHLNTESGMPFTSPLVPDKRLIDFLFGQEPFRIDPQYSRFCQTISSDETLDPFLANLDLPEGLNISYGNGVKIFSLYGDEGSGRRFTIRHFCQARKFRAINLDAGKLFGYDFKFVERALWGLARECLFSNAVCCLSNLSDREEEKDKIFGYMDLSFSLLQAATPAIFVLSELKFPLRECCPFDFTQFELPTPSNRERVLLWQHYAQPYALQPEVDLEEMATKFLFTGGKIKNSLKQGMALSQIKKFEKIDRLCLFESCYNQMKHELTQKATKVKATYTWEDIIMPPDQRQTLEYVCDQMKYRKQVYEGWNYNRKYPYGRGLSVLLFGHPGTGKTMCAQVLANALNLELYRVDLSKVIDKYVGETEKSISMIFREAKKCNVVLFFDEADTMFGKRTDSGGAGEQSANNKTAHLLQEIEAYDGVSILATNFKHNIDPAFFRRMKFVVEFAFPDPETRYRIWKATIPKETPLNEDVDLRFIADRFEFVGGNIKNCILNAAFFAAADGEGDEMSMKHLLLAVKYELIKTGKVFTRTDFEPYASLII